jgi:hypothetical protein
MAALIYLKSLSLFFHGINYHKIETYGYHIESWYVIRIVMFISGKVKDIFFCLQGGVVLCNSPFERSSPFLHYCPDWLRMGIHQTHPHGQGKKSLHDYTSIAGTVIFIQSTPYP